MSTLKHKMSRNGEERMTTEKEKIMKYVCNSCGFAHTRALPKCMGCGVETKFAEAMAKERQGKSIEAETDWKFNQPINWCALGLIVFFFVPWVKFWAFQGSAYDIAVNIGETTAILWAIPALSIITLVAGLSGFKQKNMAVLTSMSPFVALGYGMTELGTDIFQILTVGAWLTCLTAVGMFIANMAQREKA